MIIVDWERTERGSSRSGFAKMGGGRGFSAANLKNFRQFYLVFHKGFREGEIPGEEICYIVCSELSWSHYRHLMRVEDPDARGYYIRETVSQNWTVRTLERQIDSLSYERPLASRAGEAAGRKNPKRSRSSQQQPDIITRDMQHSGAGYR